MLKTIFLAKFANSFIPVKHKIHFSRQNARRSIPRSSISTTYRPRSRSSNSPATATNFSTVFFRVRRVSATDSRQRPDRPVVARVQTPSQTWRLTSSSRCTRWSSSRSSTRTSAVAPRHTVSSARSSVQVPLTSLPKNNPPSVSLSLKC